MEFSEFKEMISYYDYPTDESYKLAYIWLHPEYIPKKQVSLGIYEIAAVTIIGLI